MKSHQLFQKLATLIFLSSLTLCSCKDEQITELQGRVAKLEAKLNSQERLIKELSNQPTPVPSPTIAPIPAVVSPVTDTLFSLSGDEKDDPFIGEKDAKLILMAFFDYESQASRRFANVTLPELKKNFMGNKIWRFVLRDYPLPTHENGVSAATYAQCAGEQGKYWDAFEKLTSGALEDLSKTLEESLPGINAGKFKKCRGSTRYLLEIEKDQRDGQALGTQGSPSFFIGKCESAQCRGKFIRGAQPLGLFRKLMEELEKS